MAPTVQRITEPVERILDDARNITAWTTIDSSGFHWLSCDLCKKNIRLTVTANMSNMQQHRNGRDCKRLQKAQSRSRGPEAGIPPLQLGTSLPFSISALVVTLALLFHTSFEYSAHTQPQRSLDIPGPSSEPRTDSSRTFLSPTCSARNPLGLSDSARIPVEVPTQIILANLPETSEWTPTGVHVETKVTASAQANCISFRMDSTGMPLGLQVGSSLWIPPGGKGTPSTMCEKWRIERESNSSPQAKVYVAKTTELIRHLFKRENQDK
ncbi:hypothetical protein NMY22_g4565 [Coprinellus aureogranulatus]|nr:hypothetical protein NMY22_g4565 [Coprinellus aureogranulatus]